MNQEDRCLFYLLWDSTECEQIYLANQHPFLVGRNTFNCSKSNRIGMRYIASSYLTRCFFSLLTVYISSAELAGRRNKFPVIIFSYFMELSRQKRNIKY